jgi:hypothetical protein
VPNNLAFPPTFLDSIRLTRPNAAILNEDITIGAHGTKMATIAAGKVEGVAPNANLHLIKAKGSYLKDASDPDNFTPYAYQPSAIALALTKIRADVQRRLNADPNAKSVINMSFGMSFFYQGHRKLLSTV